VDLALKLDVLAVCAVFAFVGAILLGAFWVRVIFQGQTPNPDQVSNAPERITSPVLSFPRFHLRCSCVIARSECLASRWIAWQH